MNPLGIGIPHCLMEDDTINGYFLPKGLSHSTVVKQLTKATLRNHGFF